MCGIYGRLCAAQIPLQSETCGPAIGNAAGRQPLGCQLLPEFPRLQRPDLLKAAIPGAAHILAARLRQGILASVLSVGLAAAVLGSAPSSGLLSVPYPASCPSLYSFHASKGLFLVTTLLANLCLRNSFLEDKSEVHGVFIQ